MMNYAEALTWCLENDVTLRTWKTDDGVYRIWLCKLLDPEGVERIKIEDLFLDTSSALRGIAFAVESMARQMEEIATPKPGLKLVHSA